MLHNKKINMDKIFSFLDFSKTIHFTVDDEVYTSFQICSKDKNPLHTDISFAIEKGFNGKVMYGNILNAFVSYAIGMELPTPDVIIQTQDIQFKQPVYLYDTINMIIKTEDIHESVHVVRLLFRFINQNN